MSYLSTDMSRNELLGYAAYGLGGSVIVGALRLGNQLIRTPQRISDYMKMKEMSYEHLNTQDDKVEFIRLSDKMQKTKWEVIKGAIELVPILGPLVLLVASLIQNYLSPQGRTRYDEELLNNRHSLYNNGDSKWHGLQNHLKLVRGMHGHKYQDAGFEFCDLRFLGINNLYRSESFQR